MKVFKVVGIQMHHHLISTLRFYRSDIRLQQSPYSSSKQLQWRSPQISQLIGILVGSTGLHHSFHILGIRNRCPLLFSQVVTCSHLVWRRMALPKSAWRHAKLWWIAKMLLWLIKLRVSYFEDYYNYCLIIMKGIHSHIFIFSGLF